MPPCGRYNSNYFEISSQEPLLKQGISGPELLKYYPVAMIHGQEQVMTMQLHEILEGIV